jgi:hypothetical protein
MSGTLRFFVNIENHSRNYILESLPLLVLKKTGQGLYLK